MKLRKDGLPDARYARTSGMVVQGTRVDFFQPLPVCGICAWADRNHRQPFPHRFRGAMHCAIRVAA